MVVRSVQLPARSVGFRSSPMFGTKTRSERASIGRSRSSAQ